MSRLRLIAARSTDPPVDAIEDPTSLPNEVLENCCGRVRAAAVVIGTLWLFALVMNNVVVEVFGGMGPGDPAWPMPGNLIAGTAVLLSILTAARPMRRWLGQQRYVDAGLAYMVAMSALAALVMQWHPHFSTLGVSWVAVLILIYPAIAPSTARKTLITGLLAASMEPAVIGIGLLRGLEPMGNTFNALWYLLPSYLCALAAVIPARVIGGLGRQVGKPPRCWARCTRSSCTTSA